MDGRMFFRVIVLVLFFILFFVPVKDVCQTTDVDQSLYGLHFTLCPYRKIFIYFLLVLLFINTLFFQSFLFFTEFFRFFSILSSCTCRLLVIVCVPVVVNSRKLTFDSIGVLFQPPSWSGLSSMVHTHSMYDDCYFYSRLNFKSN